MKIKLTKIESYNKRHELLQEIEDLSYVCIVCGNKIYPTIKSVNLDGESIDFEVNKKEVFFGCGCTRLKGDVCQSCIENKTE